jgi:tetratricopeptide (TPR) repeat protein
VEPLIPPAGSVLIVTSRQHFALPRIKTVDLSALPMEKAVKLLVRIAPRIEARAEEVAELCARLPLALRAAASALAVQDDLSVKDLLKRLQDKKKRLKLTGAGPAIAASYDLLPSELRARWRLLAVFPGDFDAEGAAAVWDCAPDQAKDSLSALRRASMLEWNEATKRYRLHDLARDFAESRLQRARPEAEKRHAEHYKRVLAAADDTYLKGGDDTLRGLALFDREQANIEAGQAWAAANAEEDATAARLASSYPDAGVYVLDLRQHPREQIRWLEAAVAAARRLNDRKAEGNHLGNLGNAHRRLGETRKAIETYEQRLEIAREIGDRRGEGTARGNLGLAYAALGETRKAIDYYEQALAISHELGDRRGEGNALGNLGNAYYLLGETRKAIETYEQVLAIHREIGNRSSEAITSWNLGLAYEELGDLARAAELMQVRVDYERELGHPDAEKRAARR